MNAMLAGFAAIAVISFFAYFGLQEIGFSAEERNAGAAVRLN